MDISELQQLIDLISQSDITEFELREEGVHLRLTRSGEIVSSTATANLPSDTKGIKPAIVSSMNGPGAPLENDVNEGRADLVEVESPIVGTFYRKPSPDSKPFVAEGAVVKKGDTLCIVEAMKLMNEIESPCDGKIEKILLKDGQVVEYGETLFFLNPSV